MDLRYSAPFPRSVVVVVLVVVAVSVAASLLVAA